MSPKINQPDKLSPALYQEVLTTGQANEELSVRLDAITSRGLDARTIDTYADTALTDLVELVDDVMLNAGVSQAGAEQERLAFMRAGLDPQTIEATLDRITEVAQQIDSLDEFIAAKTQYIDKVILPPNPCDALDLNETDGSFSGSKEVIAKLKTLLLLLDKSLDIDIASDDVKVSRGALRPGMMRTVSYDMVEIPNLHRLVLSCDQLGNATFVFDTAVCDEFNISADDIAGLAKDDLKSIIDQDGRIGRVIRHSSRYAKKLSIALVAESLSDDDETSADLDDLLSPKVELAPEGYMSERGISKNYFDAGRRASIEAAIRDLEEQLGETCLYRFGRSKAITVGYSPEQIEMITRHIDLADQAFEGFLSTGSLAKKLGAGYHTIESAIGELAEQLGDVKRYPFERRIVYTYSPEQIAIITQHLDLAQRAPEEFISRGGIAKTYGLRESTIDVAIDKLGDKLGEVGRYLFGPQTTHGYSPEQVGMILEHLDRTEPAPDGYLSMGGIADDYNFGSATVRKAIDELGSQLGDVERHRFRTVTAHSYSPEQVQMILRHLDKTDPAPDGYLSLRGVALACNTSHATVQKAVNGLGDRLIDTHNYRFGVKVVPGYSVEQQRMIVSWLHENSKRSNIRELAKAFLQRD